MGLNILCKGGHLNAVLCGFVETVAVLFKR